jgi:hypothetical protein
LVTTAAVYLTLCGVFGEDQEPLLELARCRYDDCWVQPHNGLLPDELPALLFQHETAHTIRCYEPAMIPARLQTDEYATLQLRHRFGPDVAVTERVRDRMDRQRMYRARKWIFYLHETTLRSLPGDAEVRQGQLLYLAMLIGQHSCKIRVVPAGIGQADLAATGFQLIEFAEHQPVTCTQTDVASLFLEGQPNIDAYTASLDRLDAVAVSESESIGLITSLIRDRMDRVA